MTLPGRDAHGDPSLTYRLAHAPTGEVLEGSMPDDLPWEPAGEPEGAVNDEEPLRPTPTEVGPS
jgi:hypothetical protein